MEMIGRLAFLAGLVISVAAGWLALGTTGALVLLVLGLVVGLLNVSGKETGRFLVATIVLIVAGLALREAFGETVARILTAYISFTSAAGLVVAIKEVYSIQRD
ncbi:hypothetical protein C4580_02725 [Candidatus Woesearchaeota archaeon]|nr:MAG: hypothetical protein C4580_02725 [Candidatus Woesearchaeota archaeon]